MAELPTDIELHLHISMRAVLRIVLLAASAGFVFGAAWGLALTLWRL